jgi:YVTN family beta-propeller protein
VGKAAPIGWVTTLVGKAPTALGVDTTTGRAFIANTGSNTVSLFDDKTGRMLRVIPVGQLPVDGVEDVGEHASRCRFHHRLGHSPRHASLCRARASPWPA